MASTTGLTDGGLDAVDGRDRPGEIALADRAELTTMPTASARKTVPSEATC